MTATFAFVLVLVILALIFDYINGFHDAANSIATVVSTRVLSPGMAVIWAAFFNFIAFAVFGTRVAKSIGDGVRMDLIAADLRLYVLLCALLGAIMWNLITWYLGLPTSSSHALLGGYAGAGIAAFGGISGLLKTDVWVRTLTFIVLSPLVGMFLGFTLMVAVHWIFRRTTPRRVDGILSKGSAFFRSGFLVGPRRERRTEDDGNNHGSAHRRRNHRTGLRTRRYASSHPTLGSFKCARGNRFRYPFRRLANRAHNGLQDYKTQTDWWLLCGKWSCSDTCLCDPYWNSRLNHAYHYWRNCRRWCDSAIVCGQMGRCRANPLGLDPDHPCRCDNCGTLVLARPRHPSIRGLSST